MTPCGSEYLYQPYGPIKISLENKRTEFAQGLKNDANFIHFVVAPVEAKAASSELNSGGKPSTWLPPGGTRRAIITF